MRQSHLCPKCGHDEILVLPQLADRDDKDRVRPLVAHVVHYDWRDDIEIGLLQAYVCRACGFTELYTQQPGAIPIDRIPGAQVLRGTKPSG